VDSVYGAWHILRNEQLGCVGLIVPNLVPTQAFRRG
jgi:hypothetical protein